MKYAIIQESPHKVIAKCDKLKTAKAIIDDEETEDLINQEQRVFKIYDTRKDKFIRWKSKK